MISKLLNVARSNNSVAVYAIAFPELGVSAFPELDNPIEIVVPYGVNTAIFEYNSGAKVFVNSGVSASAIPNLGSFVTSSGRMNPTAAWVVSGESLWLQTLNTSGDILSIGFYNNGEIQS